MVSPFCWYTVHLVSVFEADQSLNSYLQSAVKHSDLNRNKVTLLELQDGKLIISSCCLPRRTDRLESPDHWSFVKDWPIDSSHQSPASWHLVDEVFLCVRKVCLIESSKLITKDVTSWVKSAPCRLTRCQRRLPRSHHQCPSSSHWKHMCPMRDPMQHTKQCLRLSLPWRYTKRWGCLKYLLRRLRNQRRQFWQKNLFLGCKYRHAWLELNILVTLIPHSISSFVSSRSLLRCRGCGTLKSCLCRCLNWMQETDSQFQARSSHEVWSCYRLTGPMAPCKYIISQIH